MSDAVLRSRRSIGILTVNNPPVNALAAAVRGGIKRTSTPAADPEHRRHRADRRWRTFIAGADIREFGKPARAQPGTTSSLPRRTARRSSWQLLHGTPLGGLETALGALSRGRSPRPASACRVHPRLLPAPAFQRLPRLAGASTRSTPSSRAVHPRPEARARASSMPSSGRPAVRRGGTPDAGCPERRCAACRDLSVTLNRPTCLPRPNMIARRARLSGAVEHHQSASAPSSAVRRGHEARARLFIELLTSLNRRRSYYFLRPSARRGSARRASRHTPQRRPNGGIIGAARYGASP